MTQPDRQNGDRLLKTARSRIAAMKIAPCSGIVSSRAAAEELERALDYLATPQPARDAAEGQITREMQIPKFDYCCHKIERKDCEQCSRELAPPKPAPDAMRAEDQVQFGRRLHHKPFPLSAPVPPADDGMVDRESLIAKYRAIHSKEAQFIALCIEAWHPVPPADGAKEQRGHCWCGMHVTLKHRCDRCMKRGNFASSGTGAAEPVARPSIDWLAKEIVEKASLMMSGKTSYLQHIVKCAETIQDRLVAPPVRGDRETAREIVTEWLGMFNPPPQIDFQQSEFLQNAIASALAIPRTALPVQPGAGERERAFIEVCDELGCAYDKDSFLIAIDNLKQRASGFAEDAPRICDCERAVHEDGT